MLGTILEGCRHRGSMEKSADVRRLLEYIGDPTFRYMEIGFSDVAPLPSEALAESFLRSGRRDVSAVLEAEKPQAPAAAGAETVRRRVYLRRAGSAPPTGDDDTEAEGRIAGPTVVAIRSVASEPVRAVAASVAMDARGYGAATVGREEAPLPLWLASASGTEDGEEAGMADGAAVEGDDPDADSDTDAGAGAGKGTPLADVFGRLGR